MPSDFERRLARLEAALGNLPDNSREAKARALLTHALVDDMGWPAEELEAHLSHDDPLDDLFEWTASLLTCATPPWWPPSDHWDDARMAGLGQAVDAYVAASRLYVERAGPA